MRYHSTIRNLLLTAFAATVLCGCKSKEVVELEERVIQVEEALVDKDLERFTAEFSPIVEAEGIEEISKDLQPQVKTYTEIFQTFDRVQPGWEPSEDFEPARLSSNIPNLIGFLHSFCIDYWGGKNLWVDRSGPCELNLIMDGDDLVATKHRTKKTEDVDNARLLFVPSSNLFVFDYTNVGLTSGAHQKNCFTFKQQGGVVYDLGRDGLDLQDIVLNDQTFGDSLFCANESYEEKLEEAWSVVQHRYGDRDLSARNDMNKTILKFASTIIGAYVLFQVGKLYLARRRRIARGEGNAEEARKNRFRQTLEHLKHGSNSGELENSLKIKHEVTPIEYVTNRRGYFTPDGKRVELTPVGPDNPHLVNFHWSYGDQSMSQTLSTHIIKDARKYGADAVLIGKPEYAHGNAVYGYSLFRKTTVSTSLEAPERIYQHQPDGRLLSHS